MIARCEDRAEFIDNIELIGTSWDFKKGAKLMEHSYLGVDFVESVVGVLADQSARVVWAGDYADAEPNGDQIYSRAANALEAGSVASEKPLPNDPRPHRYIVNLDRGEYVDCDVVKVDPEGYRIHPLPLLVAEGNGRGGGDFRGNNEYLGAWARDLLAATNTRPNGLEEIVPNFQED